MTKTENILDILKVIGDIIAAVAVVAFMLFVRLTFFAAAVLAVTNLAGATSVSWWILGAVGAVWVVIVSILVYLKSFS